MSGKVGGPPQIPPPRKEVGDFADDQVGAQKTKAKQAQESAGKTKGKQDADKANIRTEFVRGSEAEAQKADASEKELGQAFKDPKEQAKANRAAGNKAFAQAATQMASINDLLDQLSSALDMADVIVGSFVDDKLGGQLVSKRSSKERSAKERMAAEAKEKSAKELKELPKSAQASADGEPDQATAKDLKSLGKSEQKQLQKELKEASGRGASLGDATSVEELIETIQAKAAELIELGASIDAHADSAELRQAAANMKQLMQMVLAAHLKFKGLVLPLLFGEFGALLKKWSHPYSLFEGLFARLKKWPKTIPPGKMCERNEDGSLTWNDEDWDKFISWIVSPEPFPEDLETIFFED